jgi:hypothetical protein
MSKPVVRGGKGRPAFTPLTRPTNTLNVHAYVSRRFTDVTS